MAEVSNDTCRTQRCKKPASRCRVPSQKALEKLAGPLRDRAIAVSLKLVWGNG